MKTLGKKEQTLAKKFDKFFPEMDFSLISDTDKIGFFQRNPFDDHWSHKLIRNIVEKLQQNKPLIWWSNNENNQNWNVQNTWSSIDKYFNQVKIGILLSGKDSSSDEYDEYIHSKTTFVIRSKVRAQDVYNCDWFVFVLNRPIDRYKYSQYQYLKKYQYLKNIYLAIYNPKLSLSLQDFQEMVEDSYPALIFNIKTKQSFCYTPQKYPDNVGPVDLSFTKKNYNNAYRWQLFRLFFIAQYKKKNHILRLLNKDILNYIFQFIRPTKLEMIKFLQNI